MKQTHTIGYRVPLLPDDASTREGLEAVLSSVFDAIADQGQDQGYDLLWGHLSVKPDKETYEVRRHGEAILRVPYSLTVSVLGVRDVEDESDGQWHEIDSDGENE